MRVDEQNTLNRQVAANDVAGGGAAAVQDADPGRTSGMVRVADAVATVILVLAALREAVVWLGAATALPAAGPAASRALGLLFAGAAAYGLWMGIRMWRRVG